mgnify:CR=1 FL=1
MIVDKDTQDFINLRLKNHAPKIQTLTPVELRDMRAAMASIPPENEVKIDHVENFNLVKNSKKINLRLYRDQPASKNSPLIIFFHGGGFVMGDLESHDLLCRHLCKKTKSTLIAVDYRLAPENKFPSAIEDSIDAVNYIFNEADKLNFDEKKVIVCGDSAGGNLALLMSIYAKKKEIPKIAGQILVYPWIDLTMSRPSMDIKLDGILVEKETLLYFSQHYLNNIEDQIDWRASPILYPDLSNLPPTFIYSAGIDPLVDEGDGLRRRLLSFDNEVHYKLYPGQMHAFISNIVNLPTSIECIKDVSAAAKNIFNRS